MTKFTNELTAAAEAAGILEPGEQMHAAVRGLALGGAFSIATHATEEFIANWGSLGERFVGADLRTGREAYEAAGLPEMPKMLALGLTSQRLLIFERSRNSGKLRDKIAEIPRDQIVTMVPEKTRNPIKPHRLTVLLRDGVAVPFEIVKVDGVDTIADAFTTT